MRRWGWFAVLLLQPMASGQSTVFSVANLNYTRYANGFSGATADVKIANCIADLPSTGGTCDARGLTGAQTWAACPTWGANPLTLALGAATISVNASCTIPSNVTIAPSQGTTFLIATGVTLTWNATPPPWAQLNLFTLNGTGLVGFLSPQPLVNPLWWTNGDFGNKVNLASASLPAAANCAATTSCGGQILIPQGAYTFTTPILLNSALVNFACASAGGGYDQNAGTHAICRLVWGTTGGAGPIIRLTGAAVSGSRLSGLSLGNSSFSLNGFVSVDTSASGVGLQDIFIDRPSVQALSYGVRFGDPSNAASGSVNDDWIDNSQIVMAAPIGFYNAYTQANVYAKNSWFMENGVVGTVNTQNAASGTCAANCVTWATGAQFPTDGSWNGAPIEIGNAAAPAIFIVSSVQSATLLSLTTAPGTLSGVIYARAANMQFGSLGSVAEPSNLFDMWGGYLRPMGDVTASLPEASLADALFLNYTGSHNFVGTTFEVNNWNGLTSYAIEVPAGASVNGSISCSGCNFNASKSTGTGGVTAFVHLNQANVTYTQSGTNIRENPSVVNAAPDIFQNDSSAAVSSLGASAQLTENLSLAAGAKGVGNVISIGDYNGTAALAGIAPAQALFGGVLAVGQTNPNAIAGDIICSRATGAGCKIWAGTGANSLDYAQTSGGAWSLTPGKAVIPEGTAPTCPAAYDSVWADSTGHRLKFCDNGGVADSLVGAATTDTLSNKSLAWPDTTTESNAPRFVVSCADEPGVLGDASSNFCSFLAVNAITIQSYKIYVETAAGSCTTIPTYDLVKGATYNTALTTIKLAGAAASETVIGVTDQGVTSGTLGASVAANTFVWLKINTPAAACAAKNRLTIEYTMQ